MPQSQLTQLAVLDLVPFGNTGPHSAFYALRLAPSEWEAWLPGQFIMLRPAGSGSERLWGRPFAICQATSRDLVIFFQVRGRATSAMAKLQAGDVLDVWGPLGNGFAVEPEKPTLLLAGGIGIAPFVGYVQAHPSPLDLVMEFGHRMPLECYPFEGISGRVGATAHLESADEDRERFLALMDERIRDFAARDGLVLACGPTPFLRAVQAMSARHKARTQLCLETRMACGVGACLGCVVKTRPPAEAGRAARLPEEAGRYVQTCTCGPNFWADAVVLD